MNLRGHSDDTADSGFKNNGKADSVARAALRAAGISIAEQVKGGHKSPAISVGSSTYIGLVPIGKFIQTVQGES